MLRKIVYLISLLCVITAGGAHSQTLLRKFNSSSAFARLGNNVLFEGDDGTVGAELWKTDGTPGGTVLVKDINPGSAASSPAGLIVFNNKVYFSANDPINGPELWQSDGTSAGTKMVKDINPSHTGNTGSQPANFIVFNNALYFTAAADGNYTTLWKTDGTAAGTVQVTSNDNAGVSKLTVVGNSLYYVKGFNSLWQTDGTTAGTKQIQVDDYYTVELLHNINNHLVFITSNSFEHNNIRLYQLDPSKTNPVLLKAFDAVTYGTNDIDNITSGGQGFYFSIRTSDANDVALDALWTSDGTPAGTKSITSYPWSNHFSNSYMHDFFTFNNKFYFAVTGTFNLYTSDGTAGGTVQVGNVPIGSMPVISGTKIYFNSGGNLWSFNGTNAVQETRTPANPASLYDANGKLYFTSGDYYSANLWSNASGGQLQVAMGYQGVANGDTKAFTSKTDSAITTAVTVVNAGNGPLTFSEISVAGNSFYVNGQPSQTLSAGSQASFNLVYSPIKQEQANATLVIKANDKGGSTNFSANLTGATTGTAVKPSIPANGLEKSIIFADSIPGFTISANTIAENAPSGTVIGSFKIANSTANYQYQLTSGRGDTDNGSFKIVNGQLVSVSVFNFNNQSTYSINITATGGNSPVQKSFVVQVTNIQNLVAGTCAPVFRDLTYSLNDAKYVGSRIVAVGTGGKIISSDDDGKTWNITKSGIGTDLMHIAFSSSKIGYILGYGGAMLKTENGGNTWFPLAPFPATLPGVNNFSFPSDTVGYAFGSGGVFKTVNGGHSWVQLGVSNYNNLTSGWFSDEKSGFICGSSGTLLHTTDGGNTWQSISVSGVGQFTALNNIIFTTANVGYITSSAGDVLQSKDGGATWPRISTVSTDGAVNGIYFVNASTGYLLTGFNNPGLFKTTDGGQSWQMESINSGGAFTGLAVNSSASKICLVGHAAGLGATAQQGSVIFLKNGSGDWLPRSYLSNNGFNSGNLFASGTGYVFGQDNLKTTDGGITWTNLNVVPAYPYFIVGGYFLNSDTGFYADTYSIYKTVDGAKTWKKTNTDSTTTVQTIYFYNSKLGFYSNSLSVYRTLDGGDTWQKIAFPSKSSFGLNSIYFIDSKNGFATGDVNFFYKTTDGGSTWTSQGLGDDSYLTSVYFFDNKTGLIGGANGLVLRTIDGGQTWSTVYTQMLSYLEGFQFLDKQHGYALNKNFGGISEIYETTDAGLSWNRSIQVENDISGFRMNDGRLFLTGSAGYMTQLDNNGILPSNAGYIAGDTTVVTPDKMVYTTPKTDNNTYYKWTITGSASVEYNNNSVTVAWKQGGKYTLQVTPYNNCGTGDSRIINVDVEDMPDPKVEGPDTVLNHETDVYSTANNNNNIYYWTATGNTDITPTLNSAKVSWGNPGTGTVTVVETNQKLNMQKSSVLGVLIKKANITLPDSNFTVSVTSSTCKGSNNGFIRIKAQQSYSYSAAITYPDNSVKNYPFTDSISVKNLLTGSYGVCISITGTTFQRCYSVTVTEPKDLSAYSIVNQSTHTLSLNLDGGTTYYVDINDKVYQTTSNQLSLPLSTGINKIKIYTDKLCQGVIEKTLDLNVIKLFPVPFTNSLNIDLGGSTEPTANVQICNVSGKILISKEAVNDNGAIKLDVSSLDIGSYILKLTLGSSSTVFKILKQ